ncbi:MAG: hypothetical protein XD98_0142 [Microgenomates bacterium 39_6]|nr:MAG: hypothetical protein XD98_0142 [Microgenomates bacterium 39_6]
MPAKNKKEPSSASLKNKIIFWLPLFLTLAFFIFRIINRQKYFLLIQEDGPVEYLQSFFYLVAAILGLVITGHFFKNNQKKLALIYLFFSLGLFFIAGEEISWGQRIFGLDNPDFFAQHNTQEEISIHNLGPIQDLLHFGYILVGFWGAFGYFLAQPILKRYPKLKKNNNQLLFLPQPITKLYFLLVALFYFYVDYVRLSLVDFLAKLPISTVDHVGRDTLIWLKVNHYTVSDWITPQDQEVFEFILALGVLIFILKNWQRVRKQARD